MEVFNDDKLRGSPHRRRSMPTRSGRLSRVVCWSSVFNGRADAPRRRHKKAAWEIAADIGIPMSTVSGHLQAEGL